MVGWLALTEQVVALLGQHLDRGSELGVHRVRNDQTTDYDKAF